jgi:phenylacetate-CoA ligase
MKPAILDRLVPVLHPLYRHVAFPLAQRFLRPASVAALRDLRASERAPLPDLRAHQDERLRALVRWSYDTVPAYRQRFDEAGVRPEEIRTAADLERLPILTRRDLQVGGERFWSTRIGSDRHWVRLTSGSTGEPLRAVRDAAAKPLGQATWWHGLEWCGVHPADARVDIATHDRRWELPLLKRLEQLAGSRPVTVAMLFRRDAAAIAGALGGWKPRLISGQPHRLAQLARMALEGDVRMAAAPRTICYYGSVLSDDARAVIARAFRAPIHSRYAAMEFVPYIAYSCGHGALHVNPRHFIVEIVGGRGGEPAGGAAREGRLLITDLTNLAAPYLRYDVGDLAAWEEGPCACGRTWPRLGSIDGRNTEAAVTATGRDVSQAGLSREMFRAVPELPEKIWAYQFRQHALDDVELLVVPRGAFSAAIGDRLASELTAFSGGELRFRVTTVDAIPGDGRDGKRPLLVNLLNRGTR